MTALPVPRIRQAGFETERFGQGWPVSASYDGPTPQEERPPLSKEDVAALSDEEIRTMSRAVLVRTVRALLPWELSTGLAARLPFQDRDTLQRLAFQARRTCRLQGY